MNTMTYRPEIYSALKDIEVAKQLVPPNLGKIPALGDLICDHHLHEGLGLVLLHRHFDVAANERLVANYIDGAWTARPEEVARGHVKPYSWKLERDDRSGQWAWYPLEFFRITETLAQASEFSDQVAGNERFLAEFAERVLEFKAQDIFGIGLLFDRFSNREDGQVYFETNNKETRTMTSSLVPQGDVHDHGGVTLWDFTPAKEGRSKGGPAGRCAHGNSAHCCG